MTAYVSKHTGVTIDNAIDRALELPEDLEGELDSLKQNKADKVELFSGSYEDLEDKPTEFTPSSHTHAVPEVDGLTDELNSKVDKVEGKQLSTEDYTTAEKNKLDAVEPEATKNATDAQLRDRSTHTGEQAISTVTGLELALNGKVSITSIVDDLTSTPTDQPLSANQGRVLKGLIDNINTVLLSDDTNLDELQEIVDFIKLNRADLDSLSIPSIAGLEAALNSKVDKVTGKQLSTEDYTTDDKTKLTGIQAEATKNATDAQLRDRSTHTGSQGISTVTGLQDALDSKVDNDRVLTNVPENAKFTDTLYDDTALQQAVSNLNQSKADKTELFDGSFDALTDVPPLVQSQTDGIPNALQIANIVSLTQAAYDALATKDAATLYVIED